jgi:hypothetical protein
VRTADDRAPRQKRQKRPKFGAEGLDTQERVPLLYLLESVKVQESAHRRYLSAITELVRVRKLQSGTPGVQYNTQINVTPDL